MMLPDLPMEGGGTWKGLTAHGDGDDLIHRAVEDRHPRHFSLGALHHGSHHIYAAWSLRLLVLLWVFEQRQYLVKRDEESLPDLHDEFNGLADSW
jgi:hypothetical protein